METFITILTVISPVIITLISLASILKANAINIEILKDDIGDFKKDLEKIYSKMDADNKAHTLEIKKHLEHLNELNLKIKELKIKSEIKDRK